MLKKLLISMLCLSLVACIPSTPTDPSTISMRLNGKTVHYHKPDNLYDVSEDYLNTMGSTYNIEGNKIKNLVCLGNEQSIFKSKDALIAAPISETKKIYKLLNGNDFDVDSVAYSTAYKYMTTGEIPEDAPDNYSIKEFDTLSAEGLDYHVYVVSYDEPMQQEDGTQSSYTNTSLMAYTNTGKDDMEIIIYLDEWGDTQAVNVLKDFLGLGGTPDAN